MFKIIEDFEHVHLFQFLNIFIF